MCAHSQSSAGQPGGVGPCKSAKGRAQLPLSPGRRAAEEITPHVFRGQERATCTDYVSFSVITRMLLALLQYYKYTCSATTVPLFDYSTIATAAALAWTPHEGTQQGFRGQERAAGWHVARRRWLRASCCRPSRRKSSRPAEPGTDSAAQSAWRGRPGPRTKSQPPAPPLASPPKARTCAVHRQRVAC